MSEIEKIIWDSLESLDRDLNQRLSECENKLIGYETAWKKVLDNSSITYAKELTTCQSDFETAFHKKLETFRTDFERMLEARTKEHETRLDALTKHFNSTFDGLRQQLKTLNTRLDSLFDQLKTLQ